MPRESGDLLPAGDSFYSTIPAAFEQVASEHATNTAIQSAHGPISFGALNSLANRIARELLDCTRGKQPVALLLPKGMRWVAALLGTMKAALPVAPLELNRHLSQLRFQIRDLEPDALITDTAGVGTAKSLGVRSILLADDYPAVGGEPNLGLEIHPDDLAAIFYTSGSTGRPRGVMQPHRSLVNNACVQIGQLGYQSTDRMLLLTFHVGALMSSLLSGGSSSFLCEGEGGLSGILQRIPSEQITVILATTSTFRNLAHMAGGPEAFRSVRLVYVGSETVFRSDVTLFQKLFPGRAVFASNYGSTEALGVTFVDLGAESFSRDVPSIGRAFAGKEILILGPDGRFLPPGQVGELAVRSRFIGTGYWKSPDETKSRFLTDPEDSTLYTFLTRDMGEVLPDGSVFLHGRQDSMVKVRGSLVPLQEVEGALASLDGVEEAVVLASQQDDGNASLVAYLRGASGGRKPLSQIRAAMAERLSSYMIPAAFVWMDQWPRLPSGKIDKIALPKPGKSRAFHISEPAIEPRTPAENAIASVWAEGLHLDEVGVDDDFLELGGDSLSAAVIAERLSRYFLTEISATRVFESGTVSRLAAALAQAPVDETLEQLLREVESLSPEEVKRLLAENGA